jgi:HAMP domain-containing protein
MSDYPIDGPNTTFEEIYDRFFGKITDDMYVEWTKEDTEKDLKNILIDAIPGFEFPRFPLYDYNEDSYNCHLTSEEINILAILMYNTWLQRQVASIENTRQKFSGSDFKMTSQANHLDKLIKLKQEGERQDRHMQRLYKRRKIIDSKGSIKSNWSTLAEISTFND